MGMRVRVRKSNGSPTTLKYFTSGPAGRSSDTLKTVNTELGQESIEDDIHRAYGKHRTRNGGPMTLYRTLIHSKPGFNDVRFYGLGTPSRPVYTVTYHNEYLINASLVNFNMSGVDPEFTQGLSTFKPTWDSSGADFSATVFSRAKPAKPITSMSNFLIELRDLPRAVQTLKQSFEIAKDLPFNLPDRLSHIKKIRDLPQAHVGWEFGIFPIIRDLGDLLKSVDGYQEFLSKYATFNGKPKPIKRRVTVYNKTDSISSSSPANFTITMAKENLSTTLVNSDGSQQHYYAEWGDVVWGVANFYVALKQPTTQKEELNLYRRYIGLTLNPHVIWKAIPWTWLIDYAATIGDVYNNISDSAADSTTIMDGWVMRHKYLHAKCSHWSSKKSGTFSKKIEPGTGDGSSCELFHETKSRVRGDPFNVAIHPTNMSVRQTAILGSLGLNYILGKKR